MIKLNSYQLRMRMNVMLNIASLKTTEFTTELAEKIINLYKQNGFSFMNLIDELCYSTNAACHQLYEIIEDNYSF